MKRLVLLLPAVLLVIYVSVIQANTIHVPSQQPTIQAGIDAAVNGDTVLVADGTYTGDGNRDIDFNGKAIVVMSENGADSCVIDCEADSLDRHRGFSFNSGEDSSSVVQSFTITNGYKNKGGGIYCDYNSSPTITGNTIAGNTAQGNVSGGGILCVFWSSPTITGNTITGNDADIGGGINCDLYSSPTITGNTITGNDADIGGGINCDIYSSPTITGNTITGNTATYAGGGINCDLFSSPTIMNCILWGDSPDEINVNYSDPIVTYSNIQGDWMGEGNIDEDPMFVLDDKDDYRLLWGSPCIDTGNPDSLDADGTRSDMGADHFNQNDYLTLYITPDTTEVSPGGQLGVTYTAINRWEQPEAFWLLSQVFLPGGSDLIVLGPDQHTLPSNYTAQVHITHPVPNITPAGVYEYRSLIGMPPGTLYDDDSFTFKVIE